MSNKLKLYSLATPNGQKVGIALEEMELSYDAHKIDILKDEQFSDEFIKINPNSKIPALVDPQGDNGDPLRVFESGNILLYLAEKSGKFLPQDTKGRTETLNWLFFQMGGPGPMFGQFGHFFKYAKDKCDHPYPIERYTKETKRLLEVIDTQLDKKDWIAGDQISIADFSLVPWVECLDKFYEASEHLGLDNYKNVEAWRKKFMDRPAVKRGMKVTPFS